MSTLALLGLLVVLLVAIGIVTLLFRGRGRDSRRAEADDGQAVPSSEPPRTVADLVDRRRAEAKHGTPAPDRSAARTDPIETPDPADAAETKPVGTLPSGTLPADAVTDSAAEPAGDVSDEASGTSSKPAAVAADPPADGATRPTVSFRTSEFDEPGEQADDAPRPDRPGTDADTGSATPPWSRGFVGGRQIPPPAPAPRTPASAAGPVDVAAPAEVPAGSEVPTAPTAAVDPSSSQQEARSAVDPDLVKRVTAVPDERAGSRSADADTEREYREARDRMSGPTGVRSGRVPEQASRSPESAPEPARRTTSGSDDKEPEPGSGTAVAGGAVAAVAATVGASRAGSGEQRASSDTGGTADPAAGTAATGVPAARPSPVPRATPGPPPAPTGTSGSVAPAEPAAAASDPAASDVAEPVAVEPDAVEPDAAEPDAADRPASPAPGEEPPPRPTPRVMRSATPSGPEAGTEAEQPESPVAGPDPDLDDSDDDPDTVASPEREAVVAFSGASQARREPVPGSPAQDVDVVVADRQATALSGVSVSLLDGTGAPVGARRTDATGGVRLRAPGAGQYVVVSSAPGYQPGVTPCAVADGPVRVTVTLTRSAVVHGIVRTGGGEPRSGLPVTLVQDGETVADARTGSDGTFRFADLTAGDYRVLAAAASVDVRLPVEGDVRQDLELPGATSGPSSAMSPA